MQRCIHHGIAVDDVQPLAIAQIVRFFFKGLRSGIHFLFNFRCFFGGIFASERGDPRKWEGSGIECTISGIARLSAAAFLIWVLEVMKVLQRCDVSQGSRRL